MSSWVSQSIAPPALRAGDKVAVCAPASPVLEDRLRAGLALLAPRYDLIVDPDVLTATGYLAGDDDRRAEAINRHLRDPDVRALCIARGGYGLMRILDRLDGDALRRDPKLIVGFSDVTALLCWAIRAAGVRGIHGPVVHQLGKLAPDDTAWLVAMMESTAPRGALPWALSAIGAPLDGAADRAADRVADRAADRVLDRGADCVADRVIDRVIEGPLLGGNLCIVSHLVGTPHQLPWQDALVLLEDIDERPYAIDRYLTRLALAGAWQGAAAALVGDFTACEGRADPFDVIDERLRAFGVPGLRGLPVGHGARNLALPYGARCAIDGGRLVLLEAAVQ